MPVVRTTHRPIEPGNRPEWSEVTSGGIFTVPTVNGRFDPHYHDCHEYWLIFKGKAKIMSEGREFYIQRGDVVCTRAGDEHDFLEIYEDVEAFWWEEATPPGGRLGHLHRDEVKAKGHDVPHRSLPEDFPK